MDLRHFFELYLIQPAQGLSFGRHGTAFLASGILRVPSEKTVVAVYLQGQEYRIWQSCYAEQDLSCAEHVWIVDAEGNTVHLHSAEQNLRVRKCPGTEIAVCSRTDVEGFDHYPAMDVLGNRYSVDLGDDRTVENTLAAFYWHTLIPCVIEGKNASYPDGYVLSTLAQSVYAGTYPDVDHEFQIKGRIACGDAFDLDLVRRMISLQLRVMEEDPVKLWRNPCAIQPDGVREYHVRRNSGDNRTNADMFLISGNVEVLESTWLFFARTGDLEWLRKNIGRLEGAASLIEISMDRLDRLWSDVFYEDQIIKDGTECMSACLAAHGFSCLADLEKILEQFSMERHFRNLEKKLADMIGKPVPYGFWDPDHSRFIDWLDRDGIVHDHLHLLANCLPVLFGYCSEEQREACMRMIRQNLSEFQRFPTFLSARIQDYTPSEIGVPYDLCAAGRYWCWDAAYWASLGCGDLLKKQVLTVADQACEDQYEMGERYDMNYLYYVDHRNWHGAERYYEYPNVFWWVVVNELLGIQPAISADLRIRPILRNQCRFSFEAWSVAGEIRDGILTLHNLSDSRSLTICVDTSILLASPGSRTLCLAPGETGVIR